MPILPFKGVWPTIAADVFIAPGAMIIGNVTIHANASIWYNTVIRGDSAPISNRARHKYSRQLHAPCRSRCTTYYWKRMYHWT